MINDSTLCECLELNNQVLDPITMYAVMLVILSNDYKKGLNLAFKLFRILNDDARVDMAVYSDTLRLVLFPTMFDDPEWVTYVKIDEIHFCKKMSFYKPIKEKDDGKGLTKTNQKTGTNSAYGKIQRNEAIGMEFGQKNIHAKNTGSQLMVMLPMVRSVTSVLAIEL